MKVVQLSCQERECQWQRLALLSVKTHTSFAASNRSGFAPHLCPHLELILKILAGNFLWVFSPFPPPTHKLGMCGWDSDASKRPLCEFTWLGIPEARFGKLSRSIPVCLNQLSVGEREKTLSLSSRNYG